MARLGGDEFLILLEALSPDLAEAEEQAGSIADKLVDALERPYTLDDKVLTCTSSIGIALFPGGLSPIDDLLKQADQAMYQAKKAGRNRARLFGPSENLS